MDWIAKIVRHAPPPALIRNAPTFDSSGQRSGREPIPAGYFYFGMTKPDRRAFYISADSDPLVKHRYEGEDAGPTKAIIVKIDPLNYTLKCGGDPENPKRHAMRVSTAQMKKWKNAGILLAPV